MFRPLIAAVSVCLATAVSPTASIARDDARPVHSVTDISHEFTFYFDGRFAKNYLTGPGDRDARNWATLHEYDFSNVNLAVLPCGASPCPYLAEDVAAVREFLESGGGVVVLGDFQTFRGSPDYTLNGLVKPFGAAFVDRKAREPLAAAAELRVSEVRTYGGRVIQLARPADWQLLMIDAARQVVMARRSVGKGQLLVSTRAVVGRQPDAQDPINAEMWRPLLRRLAEGKSVDPAKKPQSMMPENEIEREGLKIRTSDYLKPAADEIFAVYEKSRPKLEEILGVPPSPNMLASLILLPTGGGGFSSGRDIGLGVWWGGFPEKKYGMVELLGHEATHSWVLPFAEPMWNEGIATYVGIQLGRELGYRREADAALKNWLQQALRQDPKMDRYDLAGQEDVPHAVRMAKPMWIWEKLRTQQPDLLARYFRKKRALVDPAKMDRYTADDCVAVLSQAFGRDLFTSFRSLGIDVDPSRTQIPVAGD